MAPSTETPAELLGRCHRNMAESFWQYIRLIPGATRRDLPDTTLMRCEIPFSVANLMFFPEPRSPARSRLVEASEFFGRKRPWRLFTTPPAASEVGREAEDLGLRPGPNEPGMLLDPLPTPPTTPSSIAIQPVVDAKTFADFGAVWSDSFGVPRWALPVSLPGPPPDDPEHGTQNRLFVGYVDRRPMACSAVTVTERVAGISSVGTVRSGRGKGLGTAVTGAAVNAGRALGADVAYLAATDMGYPVYERMGFRRFSEYPTWQVHVGFFRTLGAVRTLRRLVRAQERAGGPSTGARTP
jgi:GNAT superfamily N-acetyltransferase